MFQSFNEYNEYNKDRGGGDVRGRENNEVRGERVKMGKVRY